MILNRDTACEFCEYISYEISHAAQVRMLDWSTWATFQMAVANLIRNCAYDFLDEHQNEERGLDTFALKDYLTEHVKSSLKKIVYSPTCKEMTVYPYAKKFYRAVCKLFNTTFLSVLVNRAKLKYKDLYI